MQINEIDLSKEAKLALYKMVHQTPGIDPKDIAAITNDTHKAVLNYANPNMNNHWPTLKKFEALQQFTQNPSMLKVWANQLGFMLIPIEEQNTEHDRGILELLLNLNIGNGELNKHVYEILEDGVVDSPELEKTTQKVENMIIVFNAFLKAVRKSNKKYLAHRQTEKA